MSVAGDRVAAHPLPAYPLQLGWRASQLQPEVPRPRHAEGL